MTVSNKPHGQSNKYFPHANGKKNNFLCLDEITDTDRYI